MTVKIGFILVVNESDVEWYKPLSFGYIKAYVEKHASIPVEMVLLNTVDEIGDFDIIGLSSTSQCFETANRLSARIKLVRNSIVTVLGGHHITSLPQTLSKDFDIGVVGEGEATFLEIVETLSSNGFVCTPEVLRDVAGIVYHGEDGIVENPRRPAIEPLDSLPFPYRRPGDQVYLFTSRGCPFKCSFCSSTAFWEGTRFFTADYVVREIEHILEMIPDLSDIAILDDLFIADKKRFKHFVQLVTKRKYNEKLRLYFSVRANLVDEDLCQDFKRINVGGVSFGAESGSDRILDVLQKGTTVEVNQRAIDLFHKYGIPLRGSFIVGVPSETEEEVRRTYDFILKNILDNKLEPSCSVNILMPLPGTKVWWQAVRDGSIDPETIDWSRLSVFASYRDSKVENFDQWIEVRKKNNSIYLAEETLSESRLYELMYLYENLMKLIEEERSQNKILIQQCEALYNTLSWRITRPLRRLKKILWDDWR